MEISAERCQQLCSCLQGLSDEPQKIQDLALIERGNFQTAETGLANESMGKVENIVDGPIASCLQFRGARFAVPSAQVQHGEMRSHTHRLPVLRVGGMVFLLRPETIPKYGSRALIIQPSCRGSFSDVERERQRERATRSFGAHRLPRAMMAACKNRLVYQSRFLQVIYYQYSS